MADTKHKQSGSESSAVDGEKEDEPRGAFDYGYNFFKKRKVDAADANVHATVDMPSGSADGALYAGIPANAHPAAAKDMKRVMESYTCMVAGDLKRVQPKDLNDKYMCQPSQEKLALEGKRRNKCRLFYLMTDATVEEVNTYVELAFMSLKVDHVYPFDNAWTEQFDRDLAAKNMDHIRKGTDIVVKRAFIWIALYLSRKFVSVFCPRRDGAGDSSSPTTEKMFMRYTKEFTANPALLGPFVASKDSPFAYVVSARLIGLINTPQFVVIATKLWMELQPWNNHDAWGTLDADGLGLDVKLLMAPPATTTSSSGGANAIEAPGPDAVLDNDSD